MDRLRRRPRRWDRFAGWAPGAAILTLVGFAILLALAAWTQRTDLPESAAPVEAPTATTTSHGENPARDTDLRLYDRIVERVDAGENYYEVAVEEQRARDFPVRPGLAVRLPTLAYATAVFETWGMASLGVLLAVLTLLAWWVRLQDEQGGQERKLYILLLLVIGAGVGFKLQYLALHEVWAGMLIALSLGLHRPQQWVWSWVAAALALAIREHALPFVLLMAAMGWMRGQRREAFAWLGLALVFGIALAFHLSVVAQLTSEADPASPGWLTLRGLGGWTSNIVTSSPLQLLPGWLAAMLVIVPLIGWAGWKSDLGETGLLLCLGYGLAFMIAGRDNNFYWALIVMPVWFVGFAFVPRALASLWNSARDY